MIVVGVDCGFSGAIAHYCTRTKDLDVVDMPVILNSKGKTEIDIHSLLHLLEPEAKDRMAVVEQVASRPNQSSVATFRFGMGYGALIACVAANKTPMHLVTPQKWKKHFGLTSDKDTSRQLAIQRWPEHYELFKLKKHDGRAEASLIALYGAEVLNK
jgi:crossover junction endodeoxyribonuclease RuvC